MCVVGLRGKPRRPTTPALTRLRLDGILLCEAHSRCRDEGGTKRKEGVSRMAGFHDEGNVQARLREQMEAKHVKCQDRKGRGV